MTLKEVFKKMWWVMLIVILIIKFISTGVLKLLIHYNVNELIQVIVLMTTHIGLIVFFGYLIARINYRNLKRKNIQ